MDDWHSAWQSWPPPTTSSLPPQTQPQPPPQPQPPYREGLQRLESRIRPMAAEMAATTCEWLHLAARKFDQAEGWAGPGLLSCAHWLSWTCSVSPGTARDYLRVARTLPTLPLIDAGLRRRAACRTPRSGRSSGSRTGSTNRSSSTRRWYRPSPNSSGPSDSSVESTGTGSPSSDGDARPGGGTTTGCSCCPPGCPGRGRPTGRRAGADAQRSAPNTAESVAAEQVLSPDVDPFAFAAADALVALAETALAAGDVDGSGTTGMY